MMKNFSKRNYWLDRALQAAPTQRWQDAEIAIALGFSYQACGYKLTFQSFQIFAREGLPQTIIDALIPLKDRPYKTKRKFLSAVKQRITETQLKQYKHEIVASAENVHTNTANSELLRWIIHQPHIRIALVQESIFVAAEELVKSKEIEGVQLKIVNGEEVKTMTKKNGERVELWRIHLHHPRVYSDTFQTLVFAAGRLACLSEDRKILIVSHDLQLRRAGESWRVAEEDHPNEFTHLELAIPDLRKRFPGSRGFKHCWTFCRAGYALWEFFGIPKAGPGVRLSEQEKQKIRIDACIDLSSLQNIE